MKMKAGLTVLLLSCCLTVTHSAPGRHRVLVRDERGKLLMSTQAVPLSPSRVAVPVEAYKRLGLYVKSQVKAKRVAIGIPDSDSGILLYAGSHRVRDFLFEKPAPTANDTPVALLREGRFYANAFVTQKAFRDVFATTWNQSTHTITLQRTRQFAKILKKLR